MIVDTSALVAIVRYEPGREPLMEALASEDSLIPAPVVTEFNLVTSLGSNEVHPEAQAILAGFLSRRCRVEAYSKEDAELTAEAHRLHGRGNGLGGRLNMLDVMVYSMARRLSRPILCTGGDFVSTDAQIHPASRKF